MGFKDGDLSNAPVLVSMSKMNFPQGIGVLGLGWVGWGFGTGLGWIGLGRV